MTETRDTSMLERAARAGLASIDEQEAYIGDAENLAFVKIDGWVDVLAFTKAVLEAIREPDEAMLDAAVVEDREPDALQAWNAMIDSILQRE